MSKERIVRRSFEELGPDKTDWDRVSKLTDEEIRAAIASDPDAAPELDEEWFRNAEFVQPMSKIPTSLRVDADVLEWFRGQGRGWQTQINGILRAYAKAHGLR
jgi:uncharacterized protein (DUF4415 family)